MTTPTRRAPGRRATASSLRHQSYGGESGLGTTYYEYDPAGRMTKKVLGNAAYSYYAYDAAGRVMRIDHRLPGGGTACYFGYDYDAASRITSARRETVV